MILNRNEEPQEGGTGMINDFPSANNPNWKNMIDNAPRQGDAQPTQQWGGDGQIPQMPPPDNTEGILGLLHKQFGGGAPAMGGAYGTGNLPSMGGAIGGAMGTSAPEAVPLEVGGGAAGLVDKTKLAGLGGAGAAAGGALQGAGGILQGTGGIGAGLSRMTGGQSGNSALLQQLLARLGNQG